MLVVNWLKAEDAISQMAHTVPYCSVEDFRDASWVLMDPDSVDEWKKGAGPRRDPIVQKGLKIARREGTEAVCMFGVYQGRLQWLSFVRVDYEPVEC